MDFITARLEAISGPLAVIAVRNGEGQQDTLLTVRLQGMTSFDLRPQADEVVTKLWSGMQPCLVVHAGSPGQLAIIEPIIGGQPLGAVLAQRGVALGIIAPYPITRELPPQPPSFLQQLETITEGAVGIALFVAVLLLLSYRTRRLEEQRALELEREGKHPGIIRRALRRVFVWRHFGSKFPIDTAKPPT